MLIEQYRMRARNRMLRSARQLQRTLCRSECEMCSWAAELRTETAISIRALWPYAVDGGAGFVVSQSDADRVDRTGAEGQRPGERPVKDSARLKAISARRDGTEHERARHVGGRRVGWGAAGIEELQARGFERPAASTRAHLADDERNVGCGVGLSPAGGRGCRVAAAGSDGDAGGYQKTGRATERQTHCASLTKETVAA